MSHPMYVPSMLGRAAPPTAPERDPEPPPPRTIEAIVATATTLALDDARQRPRCYAAGEAVTVAESRYRGLRSQGVLVSPEEWRERLEREQRATVVQDADARRASLVPARLLAVSGAPIVWVEPAERDRLVRLQCAEVVL